jgi:hypothetical protein
MLTPHLPRTLALLCTLAACGGGGDQKADKKVEEVKKTDDKADAKADAPKVAKPRAQRTGEARVPAAKGRMVVLGGLGGNLAATQAALKAAGALDDAGNWSGGDLVVVQLGNVLGPGKDELAVMKLLDTLTAQATAAGGALYRINGEQEILNVALTFDGVSAQGFKDYAKEKPNLDDPRIAPLPKAKQGRATAFAGGGAMARKLAEHKLVLIVGDTVFAHAAVTDEHVKEGLDTINNVGKKWMIGEEAMMPDMLAVVGPARSPKQRGNEPDCGVVEQVLGDLAARRLVIARGPDKSEASMCDGKLLRLGPTTGDASGGPEILDIQGDAVKFTPVPPAGK